jgi:hypothetical protein
MSVQTPKVWVKECKESFIVLHVCILWTRPCHIWEKEEKKEEEERNARWGVEKPSGFGLMMPSGVKGNTIIFQTGIHHNNTMQPSQEDGKTIEKLF